MTNVLTPYLEQSQKLDEGKEDFAGDLMHHCDRTANFNFLGMKLRVTNKDGVEQLIAKPTGWAWSQVAAKLSASVKSTLPSALLMAVSEDKDGLAREAFSDWLNQHMKREDTNKWFVRTHTIDDNPQVRAVLSTGYAPINNTDFLETASRALDQLEAQKGFPLDNARVSRPYLTADEMSLNLTLVNVDSGDHSSDYGLGVQLGNNEVGNGALYVRPYIKRTSCDNSISVDTAAAYRAFHLGYRGIHQDRIAEAIAHGLKLSGIYLKRFLEFREVEIPMFSVVAEELGFKILGKSRGEDANRERTELMHRIIEGSEGEQNLYGLINGVTNAAQYYEAAHPDRMREIENLAGTIIDDPAQFFGKKYEWAKELAPVQA